MWLPLYCIGYTGLADSVWAGTTKDMNINMNIKRQGLLGTILDADYHSIPPRTCSSNGRRKERRERREEGWDKGNILIPKG